MKPIKINKRYIVLASIIVSLGAAVGINYWLSPEKALKKRARQFNAGPAFCWTSVGRAYI